MATTMAGALNKATSQIRSGSAPPTRGYEKPVPHPSSRAITSNSNRSGHLHAVIHSRRLPPKTPIRNTRTGTSSTSTLSAKKGRVPSSSSSQRRNASSSSDGRRLAKQHCSVAMSRTESILVSSSGDVIVCRCKRSSTPFIPPKIRDIKDGWNHNQQQHFPCCDTDLLNHIEGPWSPVLENLTATTKKDKLEVSGSQTTVSEFSTFEWEKSSDTNKSNNNSTVDSRHVLGKNGLKGGSVNKRSGTTFSDAHSHDNDQEAAVDSPKDDQNTHSNSNNESSSNNDIDSSSNTVDDKNEKKSDHSETFGAERKEEEASSRSSSWESSIGDLILSLPSFDYSHIIAGHNDMVPPSEQEEAQQQRNRRSSNGNNSIATTKNSWQRQKPLQPPFPTIEESPEEKKEMDHVDKDTPEIQYYQQQQRFYHGVPTFLSSLSQVHITKVSAHPLGAHVLMISQEALLFTYGLNNHGQLGIGLKSDVKSQQRGFHTTPILITPLLENGGKAINCAAGVDHSLVVVSTEGRRLQKLQTKPGVAYSDHGADALCVPNSPCETSLGVSNRHPLPFDNEVDERFHFSDNSVQYHQVYSFGRNNFMKLGLVRPHITDDSTEGNAEDVVLPRRVALHCTVWPQEGDLMDTSLPPQGVFDIAASAEHSAALVRRATGDIEVYMWGNASLGALGIPLNLDSQEIRGEIARKPSFKRSNISPLPTLVESLCHKRNENPLSPFATQVSLGPYCSFVVMSNGKCMSFGFSAEGMLGQGFNKIHTMEPNEVFFPPAEKDSENSTSSAIVSVSAGSFHVVALSEDGKAYSWGINSNDRLGLGEFDYTTVSDELPDKKENLMVIEWVPQRIDVSHKISSAAKRNLGNTTSKKNNEGDSRKNPNNRIALACAGYDSSIMVTESGQVLSFGKRSGRLGKGGIKTNVNTPQPFYGGLHLFHLTNRGDGLPMTSMMPRPKRIVRRASASIVE